MGEEKNNDDEPQDDASLSPFEEASRIAEGKSLAEAQAEKAAAMAELPGIMEDLGEGVRNYTEIVNRRNITESDRLTGEYSKPLLEAQERLEIVLSQITENPTEDTKRALEEYQSVSARVTERTIVKFLALSGLLPSSDEEPAPGPAGNDLMPDLFLAKMLSRLIHIDTQGPRQENAQGQVSYAVLDKPRIIPEEERQRLVGQTLVGWFQFKWGIGGMELPSKDAEAFAGQIMRMVNNPKPLK